jgi:hypothetical protein
MHMTNDRDENPSRGGRRVCDFVRRRQAATCILGALLCLVSAPSSAEEKAVLPSSDLIDMIAVCTHMTYNDGAYANQDNVLQDLRFLGIHHIRDGLPGTDSQPQLQGRYALRRLIQENIRLNIFFSSDWTSTSVAWLRTLEAQAPGAITSVEGYNEINNFPPTFEGQAGPAAAKAGQKALYKAIKSDPVLTDVPVVDMTGFEMIRDPRFSYGTSLDGYADVMNVHIYPQNGAQPAAWITPARPENYKNLGAQLSNVITEFGYSTRPESRWGFIGVDERTQAKGILNGLFDAARSGYQRVYLYELLDEKPDPEMKDREFHFGLFTFANKPKPAAKAIRNLTSILARTNGAGNGSRDMAADAGSIRVNTDEPIDGMPVRSLILTKKDGSRIVAVWRETPFWDRAAGHPLEAPSIRGDISFGTACGAIHTYDPLTSSDPGPVNSETSLSLPILDHVQLVECALRAQ